MPSLWNYMPVQHIESWLTKGIYFGIGCAFDDPNEGHLPEGPVSALTRGLEREIEKRGGTADPQLLAGFASVTRRLAFGARCRTFVSCWHANDAFSPRMSRQYGGNGVYIRTTDDRILRSVHDAAPALSCLLTQARGDPESPFHRVRYLPDIDAPDVDSAVDDLLALVFHKNKQTKWAPQDERRLIIDADTVTALTGISINGTAVPSSGAPRQIDPEGLTVEANADGHVPCLFIKATPHILVEEVGITDISQFEHVAGICARYGLRPPRLVTAEEKTRDEDEPSA
jgi:hypothetical protein